jgi:hypothetical protein
MPRSLGVLTHSGDDRCAAITGKSGQVSLTVLKTGAGPGGQPQTHYG